VVNYLERRALNERVSTYNDKKKGKSRDFMLNLNIS